ncbi:maleylpyruvate isomerase family mycothiol-dependent enzyme [Streptomyces sp. NPDC020096]
MQPPVAAVIEAHGTLHRLLADLDDEQVTAPSPLPGWSRGHVLAHLTDAARMYARCAEHALRGELVEPYDGGAAERDAILAATAGRTAAEHRAALAEQSAHLESIWAKTSDQDWSRPVRYRNADIAATVYARWREVWIHMTDLSLGLRPTDWPADLAAHAIDFLLPRLPAGTSVTAGDTGQRWSTGDASGLTVTAALRDLAAWLSGRTPAVPPTSPHGLPDLGPWPAWPPRAA